jgi:predicted DNA-binding transcriptional regulator YafY
MGNTSTRTLRLLSLLQTHRYWPGAELAQRLGVSLRTLRRDIDRLRELGYPVEAQRGLEGGYQLAAGAALPPLAVDDDEAVALAVGLRAAAQSGIAGIEAASIRAFTKVVQVMPRRLRRRVDTLRTVTLTTAWGSAPGVDAEALTTVAQACRDEERMSFSYTARGGEKSARHIEPHRLVTLGRRWYLVAYDLGRHDWRSFRLDRLEDPRATGQRFRPRELPAEDAASFVRTSIENIPGVYTVEALVHASAAKVRAIVGRYGRVEELDGGRCRLHMTVDSLDWPAFALGSVGAEFELLRPPELVEYIHEWAARFERATTP